MAVGNYFRSLTSFDLLGNLIPGVIVLSSALGVLPNLPIPSTIPEYALFGLTAFVVGEIVQSWAGYAVGERVHFKRTLKHEDDISDVLRNDETTDTDEETKSSEGGSSDEGAASEGNEYSTQGEGYLSRTLWKILHAYLGPLFGGWFPPRGTEVDDKVHANEAIDYLTVKYNLPVEDKSPDVLYRLMLSRIEDVQSPSRAIRFQARRNFSRGVWVSSWVLLVSLIGAELTVGGSTKLLVECLLPLYQLVPVVVVTVPVLWHLTEQSERNYIQYLFADDAVAVGGFPEVIGQEETDDS